jgi:GTP-binding protein Era
MSKKNFKSGFVAILGRPNVGKSTLLNALLGSKISIVSDIPQTTRYQIKGILNLKNAQIVFVDTPGMHSFKDSLTSYLNIVAKRALEGCDLILYVVDVSRPVGIEEKNLMNIIGGQNIKTFMVLNKIDLGTKFFNDYIDLWNKKAEEKDRTGQLLYFIPVSAKTDKNIDKLKDALIENLPNAEPYYDKESSTDFPLKFRIADIIREKLFLNLKEELPHSLAVEVQKIEDRGKLIYIKVNIFVKRDSQKVIVIGRSGNMLKEIGKLSRMEIEDIYKKKVFLDIWVKVLKDWHQKPRILQELGYGVA